MQLVQEAEVLFNMREVFGPQWKRDKSSTQFCSVLPLMCSVLETYAENYSSAYDDRQRYVFYQTEYT